MVSDQSTRKVIRMFTDAGWARLRTVGSHSVWQSKSGATVVIPDGHRRISPGVYRNLVKALEADK